MVVTGQVMSASQIKMGADTRAVMVKTWGVFEGFRNSMTMAFLPVVKEAAQSLFDFFNGFAQTARKHVDEMTWGIRQFYEAVKSLNIIKWIGADSERSFAALQAVILTFAAAAILWLGGMLAAAAPFLLLMAAIGLVLQDIYVYMQGGDSLIGRFLGSDVQIVKLVIQWLKLIWTLAKL